MLHLSELPDELLPDELLPDNLLPDNLLPENMRDQTTNGHANQTTNDHDASPNNTSSVFVEVTPFFDFNTTSAHFSGGNLGSLGSATEPSGSAGFGQAGTSGLSQAGSSGLGGSTSISALIDEAIRNNTTGFLAHFHSIGNSVTNPGAGPPGSNATSLVNHLTFIMTACHSSSVAGPSGLIGSMRKKHQTTYVMFVVKTLNMLLR